MPATPSRTVLLYDGDCGFCQAVVQFVLRHETRPTLHFAARQSPFGAAVLVRHAALQNVDSVVWLEAEQDRRPEQALVRSEAVLKVAAFLGGWWRCAAFARIVPRRWRDAAYDHVARHRRRWPSAARACPFPAPSVRERFIDD